VKPRLAAAALALSALCAAPASGASCGSPSGGWSATWAGTLQESIAVSGWQNQTLRMIVVASLGGASARIDLANPFDSAPAPIGHVTLAVERDGATAAAAPVTVTFGGQQAVTLPADGQVSSDPVALTIPANSRLLISLYIPSGANITQAPVHAYANETEYNYVGGDLSASQSYSTTNGFGFTTYVSDVDVATATPSTVVAIGDSITDGTGTPADTDTRWPNRLAASAAPAGLAVVDEGIVADRVIADISGVPSVTSRWQRDVLGQPGARTVVDAAGINDVRNGASAAQLEAAQAALVSSAHANGLKIILTTLTPCAGDSLCTAAVDAQRQAYNTWVRGSSSGADGFADFDAAVGGSSSGGLPALNNAYDSGDHLHPNSAGAELLAQAVTLGEL